MEVMLAALSKHLSTVSSVKYLKKRDNFKASSVRKSIIGSLGLPVGT